MCVKLLKASFNKIAKRKSTSGTADTHSEAKRNNCQILCRGLHFKNKGYLFIIKINKTIIQQMFALSVYVSAFLLWSNKTWPFTSFHLSIVCNALQTVWNQQLIFIKIVGIFVLGQRNRSVEIGNQTMTSESKNPYNNWIISTLIENYLLFANWHRWWWNNAAVCT